MKNIILCDKCKKVEKLVFVSDVRESYYIDPKGWKEIRIDGAEKHLCKDCVGEFDSYMRGEN